MQYLTSWKLPIAKGLKNIDLVYMLKLSKILPFEKKIYNKNLISFFYEIFQSKSGTYIVFLNKMSPVSFPSVRKCKKEKKIFSFGSSYAQIVSHFQYIFFFCNENKSISHFLFIYCIIKFIPFPYFYMEVYSGILFSTWDGTAFNLFMGSLL